MKNLHLIPTKKGQIITKTNKGTFLWGSVAAKDYVEIRKGYSGFHLCITSDEEIKPNKYALINGVLCKTELLEDRIVSRPLGYGGTMDICKSEYSEITITTDQDLITNGVQAIDDEFLEWFVKNPSCEFVEVENMACSGYKIIIPKEEYICYKCQNKTSNKFEICDKCNVGWKESKQETLEEAAQRYEETDFNTTPTEETMNKGYSVPEGFVGKMGVVFTKEEYNQHIEDVIKDALETANKKALIDRKPTGEGDDSDEETSKSFDGDLGYEEYIPVEYTVNKESITNTLNDTLNKYKL